MAHSDHYEGEIQLYKKAMLSSCTHVDFTAYSVKTSKSNSQGTVINHEVFTRPIFLPNFFAVVQTHLQMSAASLK